VFTSLVLTIGLSAAASAPAQPPASAPSSPGASAPADTTPATPAASATAPQQDLAALLAEADAAYRQRDQPGALEAAQAALAKADQLSPGNYDVLWRQARLDFWRADDPALDKKEKSRLGKRAWDLAERAVKANPSRVEGWFYAAGGMGQYALGIGVFTALRQGIEGKFKDRISHAEKIDPWYDDGAIQVAWGRFYYELPWPKYDARKSERALLAALDRNPDNVRARVYLADLYRKEHHDEPARDQLEKAAAGAPGRYDEPEERRWQAVARERLAAK
jgi:tetratricopeptide (TPR) repeat protein